ncbi:TIGR03086 family metal-binding protein [Nocardioides sp.]|uniref:TIGR03086 family metal-binding protein n=1 Tax=Nocardioides sp. TaxID=35761 RepID=UPI0035621288
MTFTKTVHLPVDVDEAFALITQPERLRRWQTVSAQVDLRAGGTFRWTVTPGHLASGTFTEVEPGKRIVFGWGWDGSDEVAPDSSTVTITLSPVGGGTELTLVHEGLSEEQAAMHAEGWNHYVARLEKAAVDTDAGPDEWAAAPENLDPIVSAEASLAVLQGVLLRLTREDQVKQTPCEEYDCHALAEHLFGSIVTVGGWAEVEVVNPEEGSLENRVAVMADTALTAWRARGIEGTVEGPAPDFPAVAAISILSLEFLLHAWDFAQASGQELNVSEELASYVLGLAEQIVPGARGAAFGPEIEVDGEASAMERLVAFTGRRPLVAA